MPNQPTDRQRLAAVRETLARVLRSEATIAVIIESIRCATEFIEYAFQYPDGSPGRMNHIKDAEDYANTAAKLAGVEVAKAPTNHE